MKNQENIEENNQLDIAVIGMTGRWPGAKNLQEFWQNLRNGVETISFFCADELQKSGIDPAIISDPNYVKAAPMLDNVDLFDASFFGYSPREAEMMDPQIRIFLESAWEALENAGYNPNTYEGSIGVYASQFVSTYLFKNVNPELGKSIISPDYLQSLFANDRDYLPTRISYKLNLRGPSINVQTACSSSLVAIHLARQSLLMGECDIALAGGVSIYLLKKEGYIYQDEMILSPDGHCRAFDAKARGTIFGDGVGIVVLKPLCDALADGDCIHAVIKGSAVNNDGSLKIGYTAPSEKGQAEVVAEALGNAGIKAETISYIETHGTGTLLGDPIEISALKQAFALSTKKKGFCAIGSVKTNVGHLNTAAGITSFIKTVLSLKHKLIPPSLHFETPNPQIDFASSPFYVNTKLTKWETNGTPRRAGVSSFGVGGTNAHVVLEEAPITNSAEESRPWQLLLLSAKTSSALDTATTNLAEYLNQHPELNLADVAYTLAVGRTAFEYRRLLVCYDLDNAALHLEMQNPKQVFSNSQKPREREIVFMFPGQGAQYINMGLELYQVEPVFREQIDLCCQVLKPHLGLDLRQIMYPSTEQEEEAIKQLQQTEITQPALFVINYSLALLWRSWGVEPQAMIGHSIGEYVAACLAGVFSLEDALKLVAARGKLMQKLPSGSMLVVPLSEKEVQPLLGQKLSIAVINGPSMCVVSGSTDAVDALQNQLIEQEVECFRLHTSHAFHSAMMEPILMPFTELVKKVKLNAPKISYVSNLTGTWIKATEATDPNYWAKHLRQTVQFHSGLQELLKKPDLILLEVGPGRTLNTLAKQHLDEMKQIALPSLRHPQNNQSDVVFLLNTLGQLWFLGVEIDWQRFYAYEQRHRLPLPTYPFERKRYWIEPKK